MILDLLRSVILTLFPTILKKNPNRPFYIVYCVITLFDVKRAPQSRHQIGGFRLGFTTMVKVHKNASGAQTKISRGGGGAVPSYLFIIFVKIFVVQIFDQNMTLTIHFFKSKQN
jgi:hypothetical protein